MLRKEGLLCFGFLRIFTPLSKNECILISQLVCACVCVCFSGCDVTWMCSRGMARVQHHMGIQPCLSASCFCFLRVYTELN